MEKRNFNLTLLMILLAGLAATSCTKFTHRIKGEGPVVTQTYELPTVSAVSLSISADVIITRGDSQTVWIEGQQNVINNIEKYVSNQGLWAVGYHYPVTKAAPVRIHITTPFIDYVRVSGSGNVESVNHFPDSTNVYLGISGSGNIIMSVDALTVETEISGSGKILLSGTAVDQSISISGSGDIRAFGLESRSAYVSISGSGNAEVNVTESLVAKISGSGNIYYIGYPSIQANISGSGTILNRN